MSQDKAVSTEDLCALEERNVNSVLGVLKLEAILNTLVDNKVEALKNDSRRSFSVNSSPKKLLEKLKSPKHSVQVENEKSHADRRRKRTQERHQFKKQVLRQEISVSSPDSQCRTFEDVLPGRSQLALHYGACAYASCQSLPEHGRRECCCAASNAGAMDLQYDDDYISVKMEGYGEMETDEMIAEELMRRARRKRRRRRKRRMKKSMALHPHLVHHQVAIDRETLKHYDDDLPPRAKWTIVATACLLLFMCLLLVGITLRMAPLIDEIVREENEKLLNSISYQNNNSAAVHTGFT